METVEISAVLVTDSFHVREINPLFDVQETHRLGMKPCIGPTRG